MTQPNRVTIDGAEYTFSSATVDVSPCAPTFAMSHRWGWPDARGFMICVCGAVKGTSGETIACHVHAPGISTPLYRWHGYEGLPEPRDPVEAERQRCERLRGIHWTPLAGHDVPSLDNLPAECCSAADYTSEQREFLDSSDTTDLRWSTELGEWRWLKRDESGRGLEWVGPDVQAAPNCEALRAAGHSVAEIEQELQWFADLHDLRIYWSQWRQEYDWDGPEYARRTRVRDRALAADEDRAESGGKHISVGFPYDGGIVRLGCELREADGVTPR